MVKVIPAKVANEFVKKHHYSGKVVNNSSLHFGAFLDDRLHGVLSYGSPLDKRKVLPLVKPSLWNEMLELNRMAFDNYLPKNSESRCIAISIMLIKKNAPQIKWILSFSDGTQCGDGTIYRASGFVLTGLNKNTQIWEAPSGEEFSRMSLTDGRSKQQQQQQAKKIVSRTTTTKGKHILENGGASMKVYIEDGWKPKTGFQLRYIYLIDKSCKITVPIIPFSKIDEMGAGMYKGQNITLAERQQQAQLHHAGDGGPFQASGAFDSTAALNS